MAWWLLLGLGLVLWWLWDNSRAEELTLSKPPVSLPGLQQVLAEVVSQAGLSQEQEVALRADVADLAREGWSEKSLVLGYLPQVAESLAVGQRLSDLSRQARCFGSLVFQELWEQATDVSPRQLLDLALRAVDFPAELTGTQEDTRALLKNLSPDLSPDSPFWGQFAQVVDQAFPQETLGKSGDGLARRLHQFRYLISAQQAQWVRDNYRQLGQSDRQALVAYLATKDDRDSLLESLGWAAYEIELDYDLDQSARLHNKMGFDRQGGFSQPVYPDGQVQLNLKILMSFHTEFILDCRGRFVNELDPEGVTVNGVVNGASFNYAPTKGRRHTQLDIAPVSPHDPTFRRRLIRGKALVYLSPTLSCAAISPKKKDLWQRSLYNPRGPYASGGRSLAFWLRRARRDLQAEIKGQRAHLKKDFGD